MKKFLTPAFALVALGVFTGLSVVQGAQQKSTQKQSATVLICRRHATPAHTDPVDRCHGDWHFGDNTNNWTYQAAQGPDHFTRSNGKPGGRSCTRCPNGGHIQQDFQGLQDWCVISVAAVPEATTEPSCPSLFEWTGSICFRPATPAHSDPVDRCHGNWHPLDNTNNWTYQAVQGPDHFTRSNGKPGDRSCTKCPNGGHIQQDFQGLQDWCVYSVPAQTAATAAGSCPPGYILEPL
jgi:hypothetical protein